MATNFHKPWDMLMAAATDLNSCFHYKPCMSKSSSFSCPASR